MNDATPILIVVLGLGAYLWYSGNFGGPPGTPEAPAAQEPFPAIQPAPITGGGGLLDSLAQGAGGLLSGIGAGLGTAVGSALQQADLNDPRGEARRGLDKLADAGKEALSTIGIGSSPKKARAKKRENVGRIEGDLWDMEQFAARTWSALARGDVREWIVSSRGKGGFPVIDVYYSGQAAPFSITVPDRAQHERLAWAAEGIVRPLGRWEQRGVGPISGAFVRYDPPSYSDANPYAPPGLRISERGAGSTKYEQDTIDNLARRGRSLGSKNVRRGLGLDDAQQVQQDQEQEA